MPEVTPGKRCARLDLREPGDRRVFEQLLARADVLLHGYAGTARWMRLVSMPRRAGPSPRICRWHVASMPTAGRAPWAALGARLRQPGVDEHRHRQCRSSMARRRCAGPAAGPGARPRDRCQTSDGGRGHQRDPLALRRHRPERPAVSWRTAALPPGHRQPEPAGSLASVGPCHRRCDRADRLGQARRSSGRRCRSRGADG
ncbi:MAG: CoA transferase [Burkholderiaceae bacterium]